MTRYRESEADRVWQQKVALSGSWRDIVALVAVNTALAVVLLALSL